MRFKEIKTLLNHRKRLNFKKNVLSCIFTVFTHLLVWIHTGISSVLAAEK